jgi:hypothetical protein
LRERGAISRALRTPRSCTPLYQPDTELMEYIRNENNQDVSHITNQDARK